MSTENTPDPRPGPDDGASGQQAFDALYAAVYRELKSAASRLVGRERHDPLLGPTMLVNEVYLKLFDVDELPLHDRPYFMNIAARAMRRVLVDHARRRNAARRGGNWRRITLSDLGVPDFRDEVDIYELHEALEKLAGLDERAARVVELRVFGGFTMEEIAASMGLTRRTVQKDWRIATMWLRREFAGGDLGGGGPP